MSDPVPIIADASSLIGLAKIGLLDLLLELYGGVVIPVQVLEELHVRENEFGPAAPKEVGHLLGASELSGEAVTLSSARR